MTTMARQVLKKRVKHNAYLVYSLGMQAQHAVNGRGYGYG